MKECKGKSSAKERERIDVLATQRLQTGSRSRTVELIYNHQVQVYENGVWKVVSKPSELYVHTVELRLVPSDLPFDQFVSRAGVKIFKAAQYISQKYGEGFKDKTVLDVGQCTGGFSDAALQLGASYVYGFDIGPLQVHDKILKDSRVTSMGHVDVLELNSNPQFQEVLKKMQRFDWAFADVSQMSLQKVIPAIAKFADHFLLLVKPPFETSEKSDHHKQSLEFVNKLQREFSELANTVGLELKEFFPSEITGKEGSQEYFIWCQRR